VEMLEDGHEPEVRSFFPMFDYSMKPSSKRWCKKFLSTRRF
jgi:hypothetical protein